MNLEVRLMKYDWHHEQGVSVTGFAWLLGHFVSGQEFTQYLQNSVTDFKAFEKMAKSLNGQVSIIIHKSDEIWLFTGHTWSYPVFYSADQGKIIITDSPEKLPVNHQELTFNQDAVPWFLQFGVTPACETLVKEIYQVRPGEVVRILAENDKTIINKHFVNHSFRRHNIPDTRQSKTSSEAKELHLHVFEKYAAFLKDHTVLLPLTGGYDSRLLACLLKEFGLSNVICATWGRSGSEEMKTAQKIASTLGYPHIGIPYEASATFDFVHDNAFFQYLDYAGHLSSMPYLQDYFPVRYLVDQNIIDKKTIVLPGHPGDFLRGSHLYASLIRQNHITIAGNILAHFGTSYPSSATERGNILRKIRDLYFKSEKDNSPDLTVPGKSSGVRQKDSLEDPFPDRSAAFDAWDYEERQCKFIGNSSLVYSFFGLDFMMPLFDKDLLEFYLSLPFAQRLGSKLYNGTAEKHFYKPHQLDFSLKKPVLPDHRFSMIKETIIRNMPQFLKKWYYPVKDPVYYRELTRHLMGATLSYHYKEPVRPHFYNCHLTQFYLQRVLEQLTLKPGNKV